MLELIKERTILITNKTFMDYSQNIFNDLMIEHDKAPTSVKIMVADLSAQITGEFYKYLFDTDLNDDLIIKGGE